MADKCPICFSDIGTPTAGNFIWTDDPILTTPSPSVGIIRYDDYKGYTQLKAQHIKELQDNRKQLETDLGITPLTPFSVIDTINFFQNIQDYVYQLRVSTEKILVAVGMTKDTYFNYDKDGNDMRPGNHQIDWTDIPFPVYDLKQFQSKAQHIEDLRHYIQSYWKETWAHAETGLYTNVVDGDCTMFYLIPNLKGDSIIGDTEDWLLSNSYFSLGGGTGPTHYNVNNVVDITETAGIFKLHVLHSSAFVSGGQPCYGEYRFTNPNSGTINKTISLNTRFSFTVTDFSSASTPMLLYPYATTYVNVFVDFDSSKRISYVVDANKPLGDSPVISSSGVTLIIPHTEFQGFNRNIYDDYVSYIGIVPEGLKVTYVTIYVHSFSWMTYIPYSKIEFTITDMKIKNSLI